MNVTITPELVEEGLIEAIAELGVERELINREATLESLEVDSLDLVELGQMIEEQFGVQITSKDAVSLTTVGDTIDMVLERLG